MDLYLTLGVPRSATAEDIKKAYRALAMKHHPDRNPGFDSDRMFKEIAAAYEVLGDVVQRSMYDLKGFVGRRPPQRDAAKPKPPGPRKAENPKPEKQPESRAWQPPRRQPIIDRNPIWDDNWNAPRQVEPHQLAGVWCEFVDDPDTGRTIVARMVLSPHEFASGCRRPIRIKRRRLCYDCGGMPPTPTPCRRCGGKWIPSWDEPRCPLCKGLTRTASCETCGDQGLHLWEIVDVEVLVPPNSSPGTRLVLPDGEDGAGGKMPGKLQVILARS